MNPSRVGRIYAGMGTLLGSRRARTLTLTLGLVAGCSTAPGASIGRTAAALTLGAELTLLPDLPGANAPTQALGYESTAAAGAVRATAWASSLGNGSATVAFWSAADGLISSTVLGPAGWSPLVLSDGTLFLVVWTNSAGGLVATRFDATGARLDAAPFVVSTSTIVRADSRAGVFDGRDFVLAYPTGNNGLVEVARVTTAGAVRDRRPVPTLVGAYRVRLAHAASGYLVAMGAQYSPSFPYNQIQYVRLDADLALVDAAARVIATTPRDRGLEDLASDGTDYLLLWSDEATPPAGAARLLAATVTAATGAVATPVDVGPGTTEHPDVAAWVERVAGGYLIAHFQSAAGTRVNGFTTRQLRDTGGLIEVAPVARAVGANLFGQVVPFRDGANVGLTWNQSVASGFSLDVATLGPDGSVVTAASQPLVIAGGGDATSVGVDWDGHDFGVAWTTGRTAWAARVDRTGTRVDARGRALVDGAQGATLAATPGQHAFLRYSTDGGGMNVMTLPRVDGALGAVGAEATVGVTGFDTFTPVLAGGAPGYLFCRSTISHRLARGELYFLGVDGTLSPRVSLFDNVMDGYPNVALAANRSGWTVAWNTGRDFGGGCAITIDQFTPAGAFATVPLRVPIACTPGSGNSPLAVASDGTDFLVSWSGYTSDAAVFGLRVRADGTLIDPTPLTLAPAGGTPHSVWDGRAYTVAWSGAAAQPISAVRVDASGHVLDATPAVLAGPGRAAADFALATDGAGVLAIGYPRAGAGGVVRAQVRLFDWDALPTDGGVVDAGGTDGAVIVTPTDAGTPDAAVVDATVVDASVVDSSVADVAVIDAGARDAGVVARPDVPAVDVPAVHSDVPVATTDVPVATTDVPVADAGTPPVDDGGGCSVPGAPGGVPAPRGPALLAALAGLALTARRRRSAR